MGLCNYRLGIIDLITYYLYVTESGANVLSLCAIGNYSNYKLYLCVIIIIMHFIECDEICLYPFFEQTPFIMHNLVSIDSISGTHQSNTICSQFCAPPPLLRHQYIMFFYQIKYNLNYLRIKYDSLILNIGVNWSKNPIILI